MEWKGRRQSGNIEDQRGAGPGEAALSAVAVDSACPVAAAECVAPAGA